MHYLKLAFTAFLISATTGAFSQSPEKAAKKLGPNPMFFVDSVRVLQSDLMNYDANQISLVSIFYDKEAIVLAGTGAKDGVVYAETIPFAKKRYLRYFKSKSTEYTALFANTDQDTTFQYILNDRILDKGFEGDLALVDDKILKEILIIDKAKLKSIYNIENKEIGIVIKSKVPKDLYNGKKKF